MHGEDLKASTTHLSYHKFLIDNQLKVSVLLQSLDHKRRK